MSAMYEGAHSTIIRRCLNGDRKAQHELFELYARPMFNVAFGITGTKEEAEDVLQEAFIEMFRNLNSFRGESSFGSWFKRIVINRSLNQIRTKRKLVYEPAMENYSEAEVESETDWPELSVEKIEQAMMQLPEGYKIVFRLFMFENLSHQEISDMLGISESTSKTQLFKARRKLRNVLIAN